MKHLIFLIIPVLLSGCAAAQNAAQGWKNESYNQSQKQSYTYKDSYGHTVGTIQQN